MKRLTNRVFLQIENLNWLIYGNDIACMEQLRMDKHTFTTLYSMLCTISKLKDSRYVDIYIYRRNGCMILAYFCTSCKESSYNILILKV